MNSPEKNLPASHEAELSLPQSPVLSRLVKTLIPESAERERGSAGEIINKNTGFTEGVSPFPDKKMGESAFVVGLFLRMLEKDRNELERIIAEDLTPNQREELATEIHMIEYGLDNATISAYQQALQIQGTVQQIEEKLHNLLDTLTKVSGHAHRDETLPDFIRQERGLPLSTDEKSLEE